MVSFTFTLWSVYSVPPETILLISFAGITPFLFSLNLPKERNTQKLCKERQSQTLILYSNAHLLTCCILSRLSRSRATGDFDERAISDLNGVRCISIVECQKWFSFVQAESGCEYDQKFGEFLLYLHSLEE